VTGLLCRGISAEQFKVFPGEEAGVVAVAPSNLDRVVAGELDVRRSNRDRHVFDIDDSDATDFVDAARARATATQEAEWQTVRAMRSLQFNDARLPADSYAERRECHTIGFLKYNPAERSRDFKQLGEISNRHDASGAQSAGILEVLVAGEEKFRVGRICGSQEHRIFRITGKYEFSNIIRGCVLGWKSWKTLAVI